MFFQFPVSLAKRARWLPGYAFALLLSACGGGGGGGSAPALFPVPQPGTPAQSLVLMRVKPEAAGTRCGAGGARVEAGIDADGNNLLVDSEVSSTQYICDGAAGADGFSTLVRMRAEALGSNCPQGGSLVQAGKDLNRNELLDDAEVSTSAYVCGGVPGTAGRDSLIAFASEAPGGTCAYGGQRVLSGLDLNGNGALDVSEVTTTAYLCSAAPADTRWVNVTASSAQTEPNTGYLANASVGVTLTLPPAPALGDWIKVVGAGSGGWTIAQNSEQRIVTRGLPGGMDITWNAVPLSGNWSALASSADGARLVAASSAGDLYTSRDAGRNWTLRLTGQVWTGVASSDDGSAIAAATNGGAIYLSIDGGVSWSNDASSRAWTAIASSADGARLVALAYLGQIWISDDGGMNWTARESNRAWRAVSSSASGRVLVAGTNGGQLYVSTDYGATWSARASGQYWWAVTSSADGSILYATTDTGAVWVSKDSGTTWDAQTAVRDWRGIATSADGRMAVAATSSGRLYESVDFGDTWRATGDSGGWTVVAGSADGLQIFAATASRQIWGGTRRTTTTPGADGSISGSTGDALQLQYVGAGVFVPVGYVLANGAFRYR